MYKKILLALPLIVGIPLSLYIAWLIATAIGSAPLYKKHDRHISNAWITIRILDLERIGDEYDPRCFGYADIYIDTRMHSYTVCH